MRNRLRQGIWMDWSSFICGGACCVVINLLLAMIGIVWWLRDR